MQYSLPFVFFLTVQWFILSFAKDLNTIIFRLEGEPVNGFYLTMNLGTPGKSLNFLIDTGSSNTAVACGDQDNVNVWFNTGNSSSYKPSGVDVSISYMQGEIKGTLGNDVFQFGNVSFEAAITCIYSSKNFFIKDANWQAILGAGFKPISHPDGTVEPFFDSFIQRYPNFYDGFSLQLCYHPADMTHSGLFIIGAIQSDLHSGDVLFAPLRRKWFYDIILSDIQVGDNSLNMNCQEYNNDRTIVDTGTTDLRLPKGVFDRVVTVMKDLVNLDAEIPDKFWSGEELFCPDRVALSDFYKAFPRLTLTVAASESAVFDLVLFPEQYLHVSSQLLRQREAACLKFGISDSNQGTVLGVVVLESFFVYFDRNGSRVGFANSSCNNSDDGRGQLAYVTASRASSVNPLSCAYPSLKDSFTVLTDISIALLAVVCFVIVMTVAFYGWSKIRRKRATVTVNEDELSSSDDSKLVTSSDSDP